MSLPDDEMARKKSTKALISRAEARAFARRWRLVNRAEREELRATSPATKLRQLSALMRLSRSLGWDRALAEGTEEVRRRWNQLRRVYCA